MPPTFTDPRLERARLPSLPPETGVRFPDPRAFGDRDIVAVGEDFRPGTILSAYRSGIFPWPHMVRKQLRTLWFSPDPRAVFPLDKPPHWSRSLRRTLRIHPYRLSVDTAFEEVMRTAGAVRPEGTWITEQMVASYTELWRLGWAHSVEVWDEHELVGGIYGVAIGGVFAGESMFHTRTDASKIAFCTLVDALRAGGFAMFDVQVLNPHLGSLGCVEIARDEFLERLPAAQALTTAFRLSDGRRQTRA